MLLVEGAEDLRVIPELMEANGIDWGQKENPIVKLRPLGGVDKLTPDLISAELKNANLSALGIMVDADDDLSARWQSIRNASLKSIPDLPKDLPVTGLIHQTPDAIKFGIWIMPDNQMGGMLETFLAYLVPTENPELWDFAQASTQLAKETKNAPFPLVCSHKANIYTWLAWQKAPGRQLHQAIKERVLDPIHPQAQVFVTWFKTLYGLTA
ncbi:DUF3226 domain-containing protein [Prochlorothrix hollandica]|uniref:DUF3226 domain-containing protein n=1 Tax=Prochlorothrix hollandica TaxID=1223 RepID=UPI00333FE8B8